MTDTQELIGAQPAGDGEAAPPDALMDLLQPKRKMPSRRVLFLLGLAAALVVCGGGYWWWARANSQKQTQAVYREYTVQRGDVIVGTSESSSISLEREVVTFPVSSTVEEVYVKAGSSVQEGDPLMKLNVKEIQAGLVTYQLQLQMAQLELEQAKLDQENKLLQAQQEYESALLTGQLADTSQSISVTQLEQELADAQEKLEDALESLNTYRHYEDYYDDDYSTIEKLKSRADSYRELYTDYYDRYQQMLELEDRLEVAQYQLAQYEGDPEDDEYQELLDQVAALEAEMDTVGQGNTAEALFELYSKNYDQYIDAEDRYQEASLDFREEYDLDVGDDEALSDKITSLQKQVDSYALALEQAKLSQQTGTLSAEQQQALSQLAAETAQAQYDLTVLQLSQSLDEKQEIYDQTLRQITEIQAEITDDGIIYAPCSGMVASVNLEAGDSFDVTYDEDTDTLNEQTLLTLTNIASVYVPITVSEEDILNVYIGQPASVTMNAFEGRTFAAEVDTIAVTASRAGAATVSYTVNVRYQGTNTLDMYEGMSAQITLIQKAVEDVLYINNQAITNENGIATVQKVNADGTVTTQQVKTGFSDGQYVEICSGLSERDVVQVASGVTR